MGSKCELAERMVAPETVAKFVERHGLEYVELSAKEDTNTRKPLELLTARLTYAHNSPSLHLESSHLLPLCLCYVLFLTTQDREIGWGAGGAQGRRDPPIRWLALRF